MIASKSARKANPPTRKASSKHRQAPLSATLAHLERDLDAARQDIADLDANGRSLRVALHVALAQVDEADARAARAEADVRRLRHDAVEARHRAKVKSVRVDPETEQPWGCEHGICATGGAACVGCQFRRQS